jgi:hypothetical protein
MRGLVKRKKVRQVRMMSEGERHKKKDGRRKRGEGKGEGVLLGEEGDCASLHLHLRARAVVGLVNLYFLCCVQFVLRCVMLC